MTGEGSPSDGIETTQVHWHRYHPDQRPDPLVRDLPYIEWKLEHPDLEATRASESFFPDGIPFRGENGHRMFYWRPVLENIPDSPDGACATPTTFELLDPDNETCLDPTRRTTAGTIVPVDGAVADDATTTVIRHYEPPDVRMQSIESDRVRLRLADQTRECEPGERVRVSLPEQRVAVGPMFDTKQTITPRVSIRFPGRREIVHPPVGSEIRVFPSFGLSLDALSNPLAVPQRHGELDHEELAATLDVDLDSQPYPVRVLWQAFAFTAFDPHQDREPLIGKSEDGLLLVGGEAVS
jgi:hypothetical protein